MPSQLNNRLAVSEIAFCRTIEFPQNNRCVLQKAPAIIAAGAKVTHNTSTAFNSLKACSRRVVIETWLARSHTRGS